MTEMLRLWTVDGTNQAPKRLKKKYDEMRAKIDRLQQGSAEDEWTKAIGDTQKDDDGNDLTNDDDMTAIVTAMRMKTSIKTRMKTMTRTSTVVERVRGSLSSEMDYRHLGRYSSARLEFRASISGTRTSNFLTLPPCSP